MCGCTRFGNIRICKDPATDFFATCSAGTGHLNTLEVLLRTGVSGIKWLMGACLLIAEKRGARTMTQSGFMSTGGLEEGMLPVCLDAVWAHMLRYLVRCSAPCSSRECDCFVCKRPVAPIASRSSPVGPAIVHACDSPYSSQIVFDSQMLRSISRCDMTVRYVSSIGAQVCLWYVRCLASSKGGVVVI